MTARAATKMVPIREIALRGSIRTPGGAPDGRFRYVDVSSVNNRIFRIDEVADLPLSAAPSRARRKLHAGDLLFATVRPTLRRVAMVPPHLDDATASTGYCVLRPQAASVDTGYLMACLLSGSFIEEMRRRQRGASYPAVRDSDILDTPIPLPDMRTQARIGHALLAVLEATSLQRGLIAKAEDLKRALLAHLFRDTDGPSTGLGECAAVQTGVTKGRQIPDEDAIELPYLRVANVQDGYLDLREIKTIKIRASEERRFALRRGDVLLTEGGDIDKLGRGFIWDGQIERCLHQNHVFAVRTDPNVLLPEFFAYQSQSPYGKDYFLSVAHRTTNLASINLTKLKAFPVLLPPLEHQHVYVGILSALDEYLMHLRREEQLLHEGLWSLIHHHVDSEWVSVMHEVAHA